jgi:signal transduction histidine kinase
MIADPCLIIICDSFDEIFLNKSVIGILGYASLMELKKHVSDISNIIAPSQIAILKKAAHKKLPGSGARLRSLSLNRKDGTTIQCLIRVEDFSCCYGEDKIVILCVIEKIIDWSKFTIDNAFNDILKQWDILDETRLILDFSGNILRMKNKSKKIDFKANLKWGRTNILDLLKGSDSEKLIIRLAQLKTGMKLPPTEYKLYMPGNKPHYIQTYSKRKTYHNKEVIISTIKDITENKYAQNELLKTIMETEENERTRFSDDLHDELGPSLSALKMSLQCLANQNDYGKRMEIINSMEYMLNEAINNIKNLTRNLAPGNISVQGISATINDLVFRLNQPGRIQIVYEKTGIENAYNIPFATSMYRIVLEIINNGIKHANAEVLHITMNFGSEYVNIYYDDDGRGFDLESSLKSTKGIGLRSIINRIKHYQGNYDFSTRNPNGTVIKISLPVNY